METVLEESPEFHHEWKVLIEITGGDINQLRKYRKKPYKRTNHFQKWIDKVKSDPEVTGRINQKIIKQMTGNDQISIRKDLEEHRNGNITQDLGNHTYPQDYQPQGHIRFSQPVYEQSIAAEIYNRFGKKYYIPSASVIRPTTPVESNINYEPDPQDVQLVMAQVNCTRDQAIASLRRNDGDIVNSIMSLQLG